MTIPPQNNSTISEFSPGTTIEWLNDHKIMVLTSYTFGKREAVKAYYDRLIGLTQEYNPAKPFLVLIDILQTGINWSPYIRHRAQELLDLAKARDIHFSCALLAQRSPLTQIVSLFMRSVQRGQTQYRIFYDRAEALKWLETFLPPD